MTEETPAGRLEPEDVHSHLEAISKMLRRPHRLNSSTQAALADLVDELDRALAHSMIPTEEATRLASTASHFADAVHREEEEGVLQSAQSRLEEAAIAVENRSPTVAGLVRRFISLLSDIGI